MIPFANNLMKNNNNQIVELQYWSCDCNKVIHTQKELHEHMHKHALERLEELI